MKHSKHGHENIDDGQKMDETPRSGVSGKNIELSPDEVEELRRKAGERDQLEAKWLKVHADYENTKRRLEKEKIDHIRFANEDIISALFPIVDNFDMALSAMETAKDKAAVMDGIRLVQKEFHRVLEDNGVERVRTVGEEFDPNVHEAVMVRQSPESPDGTVLEEVRPGYIFRDRLLRAAQVIVAKND
ncbi:MAG: nucleotide exchange factor GrpE [Candidatus Omnitrophica bacterium]|nr:nucleotide exchange factor GrpE [Candidatus Omnitrophota bacterium]